MLLNLRNSPEVEVKTRVSILVFSGDAWIYVGTFAEK